MIFRLASWLGTIISVISLVFTLQPSGQPLSATQGVFIGIATFGFAMLIFLDLRPYWLHRTHSYTDSRQINNYMYNWISKGGRVTIFTRDMSWAQDERMKELLHTKALRGELSICLPQRIPLANEVEKSGARILSYDELGYTPQSRFTIINQDRMDAHMAVGRLINNRHIIEEYSVGQHPAFAIANDLIQIVERAALRRKAS